MRVGLYPGLLKSLAQVVPKWPQLLVHKGRLIKLHTSSSRLKKYLAELLNKYELSQTAWLTAE
jgi:hypothetical protein